MCITVVYKHPANTQVSNILQPSMLKQSKVVENATAATRNSPVVAGPGDNKET